MNDGRAVAEEIERQQPTPQLEPLAKERFRDTPPSFAMKNRVLSFAALSTVSTVSGGSWTGNTGHRSAIISTPSFVTSIRGGANEYETKFEGVKSAALEKAAKKVNRVDV